MKKISTLHYITNENNLKKLLSNIESACIGGIDWIQLRLKDFEFDNWLKYALEVKQICNKYNSKLIINDNVEIAIRIGANGVHLGKSDMNVEVARKILGKNYIIGATANTFEDILILDKKNVDYIGLGPFRITSTKNNLSPVIGIDGYETIIQKLKSNIINIPIIGIGGIGIKDVEKLIQTGIYGLAISSSIDIGDNIISNSSNMKREIEFYIKKNKVNV